MKKKVLFFVILSINLFLWATEIKYDTAFNKKTDFPVFSYFTGAGYSYPSGGEVFAGFYDYEPYYIQQNLFFKTIKIKTGERVFISYVEIPAFGSDFSAGYEYGVENTLFGLLNTFSYARTDVGKFNYEKIGYSLVQGALPTFFNFSFQNIYYNEIANLKLNIKLMRGFELPVTFQADSFTAKGVLDFGLFNCFYSGVELLSFDKYYLDSFSMGACFYKNKIFPAVEFTIPLNICDQDISAGVRIGMDNSNPFSLYLINRNIKLPIVIFFNKDGGGLFVRL
ncbi:MAG TPA: hypothetical protein PLA84_04500 [Petrotogaceae bacterium]|nr:hypothetical protein [Petrotogaceae bacterium]HQH32765.1 hypothetical protein [Petrotogaceae bacterium]